MQQGLSFEDRVEKRVLDVKQVNANNESVIVTATCTNIEHRVDLTLPFKETLEKFRHRMYVFTTSVMTTEDGQLHTDYTTAKQYCRRNGLNPERIFEWVQEEDCVKGYRYASPILDEWNDFEFS